MAKGLIRAGKNGDISWELERGGENRKLALMVKAGMGQAVCKSREDLDEQNLCQCQLRFGLDSQERLQSYFEQIQKPFQFLVFKATLLIIMIVLVNSPKLELQNVQKLLQ